MVLVPFEKMQMRNLQRRTQGPLVILGKIRMLILTVSLSTKVLSIFVVWFNRFAPYAKLKQGHMARRSRRFVPAFRALGVYEHN